MAREATGTGPSEQLNNAIAQMEFLARSRADVQRFASGWRTYWEGRRKWYGALGALAVPLRYGALRGYWTRYTELYSDLPSGVQSRLVLPSDLEPKAATLLDAEQRRVTEANLAAVQAAYRQAYRGAALTVDAAKGLAETYASAVRLGTGALWAAAAALISGWLLLGRR